MNIEIREFINPQHSDMFPIRMQFQWDTDVVPLSGAKRTTQRNEVLAQPIRHWFINWDGLKQAGRDKFLEIFNRAHGRAITFLLLDRDDYECSLTDWSYTAAGGETTTQLAKDYYGAEAETWDEDKKDIVPGATYAPTIKIDGVTKTEDTHFTLDDTTGIIDWSAGSAPNGALSAGEVVTADYRFYFRVRFDFDAHTDLRFLPNLWRARGIHLVEDE
jgi:uncharacterized protein (TIGR02217 family)